ncbi:MAG TPA: IS1595 family transposase [Alphaproteobacteria bacterium]|nr:IS1595 family transposase [Alphaproteobacteria bacterium]
MSILNRPYFRDEEAAHAFLESILWPSGPVCPHCGVVGTAYKIAANPAKRVRYGLHKCRDCRKQFTVKVGTVFEHARVPLYKALQAAYLLCSSKKGMSAHQISRSLEISIKAAWFLMHRVREAMAPHPHLVEKLGGPGRVVESDETYIGGKEKNKHWSKRDPNPKGKGDKEIVLSLVEREGRVRSRHVGDVTAKTLRPILNGQLKRNTRLMTDDGVWNKSAASHFNHHQTVNHRIGEYVRGDVHTNTIEGYFSILKRGIIGTYHHVSAQHLKRYLAEFDFRYNERAALEVDDFTRTMRALLGAKGKRLTYKQGTSDGEAAV